MIGALFCIGFNYNVMFTSNFVRVPGDIGDERLIIYILNHWYNVFLGKEHFFRLNSFYPDKMTMGYSDALFLFGIIYSFFRKIGFDYFSSLQIMYIYVTVFGYLSSFLLFKNFLKTNIFFSVFGSILIVSLNAIQNQFGHAQLLWFIFYPSLIYLIFFYIYSLKRNHRIISWICISSFSVIVGLSFFTSYYPAWFFLFTSILYLTIYIILQSNKFNCLPCIHNYLNFAKKNYLQLFIGGCLFIIALIPFMINYIPIILSGYNFKFSEVLHYSPGLKDIINVGYNNYLWSPLLNLFDFQYGNIEIQSGFPLLLLTVFVAFFIYHSIIFFREDYNQILIYILALTAIIIILFSIKLNANFSLWYFIYNIVPGASGIRSVGRYLIVSQMIVVIFVIYNLNQVFNRIVHKKNSDYLKYIIATFVIIVSVGILLEQANKGYFDLDKNKQMAFLDKFHLKDNCRSFFIQHIINRKPEISNSYQTDALMISMKTDIPTINGYSGLTPRHWYLGTPSLPSYNFYVFKWAERNKLSDNLYSVNIETGKVRKVSIPNLKEKGLDEIGNIFDNINLCILDYIYNGNKLNKLCPKTLKNTTLLDKSFKFAIKNSYSKWALNNFWIGPWKNGYAIGYTPITIDLANFLYHKYTNAKCIFWPYPKIFNPNTSDPSASGQILIVFNTPQ